MNFRFDKLTVKAQEAVAGAQNLAQEQGHPELDSLHLLSMLVTQRDGIVKPILEKIGVNAGQLNGLLDSELSHLPKVTGGATPAPNQALQQVLQAAHARSRGHEGRVRVDRASAAGLGQDARQSAEPAASQRRPRGRRPERPAARSAAAAA